jgi:hypothetical protein
MNLPIFNHHDYQIETPRTNSQQVSDHPSHGPSHNTDLVGRPISFIGGQFAGQTVRAELHEIQKANLGRKYVHRGTLLHAKDGCSRLQGTRELIADLLIPLRSYSSSYSTSSTWEPIRKLRRKFETMSALDSFSLRSAEAFIAALFCSEIQNLGLVCTVDLFPAPSQEPARKDTKEGTSRRMVKAPSNQTPYSSAILSQYPHPQAYTFAPPNPYSSPGTKTAGPSHSAHASGSHFPQPYIDPSDVVHHVGDYPITERSKCTYALVGSTFVQPANVDYQGKKSFMFVFAVCVMLPTAPSLISEWYSRISGPCCQDRRNIHSSLSDVRYLLPGSRKWSRCPSRMLRRGVSSVFYKGVPWIASFNRIDQSSSGSF